VDPKKPVTPIYGFALAVNPHISEAKQRLVHDVLKYVVKDPKTWYERTSYPHPDKGFLNLPGMEEARKTRYLDVFVNDISNGRFLQRSAKILELNQAIHRAMERVVLRGEDSKKSLDRACKEIDAALAKK
jgi:hypothetical protein